MGCIKFTGMSHRDDVSNQNLKMNVAVYLGAWEFDERKERGNPDNIGTYIAQEIEYGNVDLMIGGRYINVRNVYSEICDRYR